MRQYILAITIYIDMENTENKPTVEAAKITADSDTKKEESKKEEPKEESSS
ncbi:MAG TPA: hypothetical protein VLC72_03195 [Nitrosopumilaceae archaeon]|nr:hypothetical protein [Nitrosopumilaceae archaeon]